MATLPAPQTTAMNLAFLYRPFSMKTLAAASAAIIVATALYCVVYNWAQGTQESLAEALGWAVANLVPWLFAFELGKRFIDDPERFPAELAPRLVVILAGALGASLLLEWGFAGAPGRFTQEAAMLAIVRRVPAAAAVAGLLLVRRPTPDGMGSTAQRADADLDVPFLPAQIWWIKAAGNYLEVRADGRNCLCRMTMKDAEALLGAKGFLRVHRSALVNTRWITDIRLGKLYDEVELADGALIRVGGAYRPSVRQQQLRR